MKAHDKTPGADNSTGPSIFESDFKHLLASAEVQSMLEGLCKDERFESISTSGELFDILMEEQLTMSLQELVVGNQRVKDVELSGPFMLVLYANHHLQAKFLQNFFIGAFTTLDLIQEMDSRKRLSTLSVIAAKHNHQSIFARESTSLVHVAKGKEFRINVVAPKIISRCLLAFMDLRREEIDVYFKVLTNMMAENLNSYREQENKRRGFEPTMREVAGGFAQKISSFFGSKEKGDSK